MKKAMVTLCAVLMLSVAFIAGPAKAQTVETAESLLVSTEMLLLSQANLAVLSLNLIELNMEHNYTTVEEDQASLQTIVDSIDLGGQTIKSLLDAGDIADTDLQFLNLLDTANESLKSASRELVDFCDDGKAEHFVNFAGDMQTVVKAMDKINDLLSK